jgi:lon-related putative ATP-dependent protease
MVRTPAGMVFAPMKDGEVLSPEQFQNLSDEERKQIETQLEALQNDLQQVLQRAPSLQRDAAQELKALNQEITQYAVGGQIDDLQAKYADFSQIVSFLDEVEKDVIEHAGDFLTSEENAEGNRLMSVLAARMQASQEASMMRYKVNLLVDNRELHGAPVIYEDNPTYQNLVGRVEHVAQLGALTTNFTLIKAGALHQANGGYLILDVRKVLQQPYAWEGLKRALQAGQIRIESLGQMLSVISTASLEPEPIDLKVKVALFGDRELYYLLQRYEPEFDQLFKVQADFEDVMERDEKQKDYARLIATLVHHSKLRPFDSGAVARVIEQSSRMVEDSERLTTEVDKVTDLLQEADYWSRQNGHPVVMKADVQKAIDEQIYRADRVRQRVQETILRGTFLIDTRGEVVGQVNGLAVLQLGGFAFGRPNRITASVRTGKGDVIDIEREVDLGGPIHSKGVLILTGFLNGRYALEQPLSLSASLVFEQSYSGVEGDSASSAELYSLLSAIAEAPIRQSLAVTGAVNQKGQVQAIGGVNEKVEGFFDICSARGLTGSQGVLIPSTNVKDLMLRADVRQAVAEGKFRIFPVEHVDQGIELLTGVPAGEADAEGNYPADTINGKVQTRLKRLAELAEKRQAKAVAKVEIQESDSKEKEAEE